MSNHRENTRYSNVAIWLHWIIAALIIGMMFAGVWMTNAIKEKETQAAAFEVYQLHKSFGISIFVLSIARLAWRLLHTVPTMPDSMAKWEQFAAHATHYVFYGLMLALPLTGWLMVSASPWGLPTIFFDAIEIPHLSMLADLDQLGKMEWESYFKAIHKYLAYGGVGLILLHVGAAIKHHFVVRDDVLARMVPLLKIHKNK